MIRAVILIAGSIIAAATQAASQGELALIGGQPLLTTKTATHARLGEPTSPEAVATLTYRNRGMNSQHDNGSYSVTWQGLTVTFDYRWNDGGSEDRITVEAPEGYVAVPRTLSLPEESTGEIQIIKWVGM